MFFLMTLTETSLTLYQIFPNIMAHYELYGFSSHTFWLVKYYMIIYFYVISSIWRTVASGRQLNDALRALPGHHEAAAANHDKSN